MYTFSLLNVWPLVSTIEGTICETLPGDLNKVGEVLNFQRWNLANLHGLAGEGMEITFVLLNSIFDGKVFHFKLTHNAFAIDKGFLFRVLSKHIKCQLHLQISFLHLKKFLGTSLIWNFRLEEENITVPTFFTIYINIIKWMNSILKTC